MRGALPLVARHGLIWWERLLVSLRRKGSALCTAQSRLLSEELKSRVVCVSAALNNQDEASVGDRSPVCTVSLW